MFSNGLLVVTRAMSLFCTLAMPLPSLTRAVTGAHYIGCGGARPMVFLEQVISFNWQPLNSIALLVNGRPTRKDIFFAID